MDERDYETKLVNTYDKLSDVLKYTNVTPSSDKVKQDALNMMKDSLEGSINVVKNSSDYCFISNEKDKELYRELLKKEYSKDNPDEKVIESLQKKMDECSNKNGDLHHDNLKFLSKCVTTVSVLVAISFFGGKYIDQKISK